MYHPPGERRGGEEEKENELPADRVWKKEEGEGEKKEEREGTKS